MKRIFIPLITIATCCFGYDETDFVTRMLAYRDLTRVTEQIIDMDEIVAPLCDDPSYLYGPHIKPGIHIYANDLAVRKAQLGEERFSIGALLVKEKFEKKEDTAPSIITVMEKVANTGSVDDWRFAMIRISDRALVRDGFKRSCVSCHSRYGKTDYVSSTTDKLLRSFPEKKKPSQPTATKSTAGTPLTPKK